jgi:hypothetical protein
MSFLRLSWLLIHFLSNYQGDRNIGKRKGARFLSKEGGIFRGKIFCTIGQDALHYE